MSIDIFSLKAIENISAALQQWKTKLSHGVSQVDPAQVDDIPLGQGFDVKFVGYVSQQYIQKSTSGEQRAVAAYDTIMKRIPKVIRDNFISKLSGPKAGIVYEIGKIPNLYSLIPMSQTAHKPIFGLKARDGVRGAHFNKVREAGLIFRAVTEQLDKNIVALA